MATTATRGSKATANAKARAKSKAKKAPAKPAPKAAAKPAPAPAKPKFVPPTPEEQEESDNRFYNTASEHGLVVDNPRTGKRLSRFIVQAHAICDCFTAKPLTPEQVAAACTQRFGIKVTAKRVERQLIDELRTGRVVQKDKGYVKTQVTANRWSMADTE